MNDIIYSPEKLISLAKEGWGKVIELYKSSSPEECDKILRILGGEELLLHY